MNITFLGHGQVGGALANHLQGLGHTVTLAVRDPGSAKARAAVARNPALRLGTMIDGLRDAEVVFVATPFMTHEVTLLPLAQALADKVVVDCTNPIGPGLTHGLNSVRSGTEALQALLPKSRVVKAFSIYGFENFENTAYPAYSVKPAMLFCGNDGAAKATVGSLITQLGWEPVDVGGAEQALHLEHMTLLWVRMVRAQGHSPNLVWAALRR